VLCNLPLKHSSVLPLGAIDVDDLIEVQSPG
jgi:hypothetical protein